MRALGRALGLCGWVVACGTDDFTKGGGDARDSGTEDGALGGAGGTGTGGASAGGAAAGGTSTGGTSTGGTCTGGTSTGGRGTGGAATGGAATGGAGGAGTGGSGAGGRPHPLYPALDLDTLPGEGGGAIGPYEPPELPVTTREVTVEGAGVAARTNLLAACSVPGTAVTVPDSAGHVGTLDFGNVTDCDVTLGAQVVVDLVYVGHLPGPTVAPTHRIRIRGGQIGSIMVDPGSSDIVFDGVVVNNGVVPPGARSGTAIYLMDSGNEDVNRFAFVNSVIRMVAAGAGPSTAGCAYLAASARNVFFANDNVVTAGNNNSWGFRIGGGDNFIVVDSTVRVSFHKLIRMNDGPVDYVYVKGGLWMREDSAVAGAPALNDSFAQLGDLGTDHVYIHDPVLYLRSPEPVSFGASAGPGQQGKSWEARRIRWFARSADVISDARLSQAASFCTTGATCDYGVGTHEYQYDDALSFPANPWRPLRGSAGGDPDLLPVAP